MLVPQFWHSYMIEFSLPRNQAWHPKFSSSKTFFHCHVWCLEAISIWIFLPRFYVQHCLGWRLLLEAPFLLPQALEMDRDPISITASISKHQLNIFEPSSYMSSVQETRKFSILVQYTRILLVHKGLPFVGDHPQDWESTNRGSV